ncbi:DUF4261 domain-containing protein [Hymenobacter actinosclerus]|uniref:DUF4261 domain-containing protein n=1 Tax=Hymenobacter actinosclerus TaxID=82805 RepID=A0A1I0DMB5_9BACT|nr:DUF4261 domain-containing protein [Hymenobacter actinosclerus]SET33483.1 protein of unknown function [Hymenobacter actinosclerus]
MENQPELLPVRLFFAARPEVNQAALAEALRQSVGPVDTPDSGQVFFFPTYAASFADAQSVPTSVMLTAVAPLSQGEQLTPARQQSWHWPEVGATLATCQYEIILTDFMTRALPHLERVTLLNKVLDALLPVLRPQVLYFPSSQKLLDPQAYLARGAEALSGLLNVRFYNIADSDAQEMLMDTLGLHALGLPDFQLRFADLDPGQVAGQLTSYAYYLFENGPVIEDGNTIQGLTPEAKWHCYYEQAGVAPARTVIELEAD